MTVVFITLKTIIREYVCSKGRVLTAFTKGDQGNTMCEYNVVHTILFRAMANLEGSNLRSGELCIGTPSSPLCVIFVTETSGGGW